MLLPPLCSVLRATAAPSGTRADYSLFILRTRWNMIAITLPESPFLLIGSRRSRDNVYESIKTNRLEDIEFDKLFVIRLEKNVIILSPFWLTPFLQAKLAKMSKIKYLETELILRQKLDNLNRDTN
ncbi:hypothetical protein GWI33_019789 [Rhynchophorus ferrugineus]|uniref:Uncharacterized protein n=1 Tax=Rhynchophorus ferrugineus TaxID=354439 RepID=A0A834I4N4_RHYFE|nr:hypothetical protein GWI33_019789 [Rhynchophorus ferrugineus]